MTIFAIIDHDIEHPRHAPGALPYAASWLAFDPQARKVLVEVVADAAGLDRFRLDYAGSHRESAASDLPSEVRKWRPLVGEPEEGERADDPLKHMKRRDGLLRRLRARGR